MLTNSRFMTAATFSFSNDSCAITWHQWHVEYPTDRKIGLFSRRAFANASSPQGYQSTGLCACCRRYGDFSLASWFVCSEGASVWSAEALLDVTNHVNARTTKRKRVRGIRTTVFVILGISQANDQGRMTLRSARALPAMSRASGDTHRKFFRRGVRAP